MAFPPGVDPALSQLEFTVDRAGLAPLAPLLARVLSYPFGCTEQTAAGLAALAAVPELARAIVPGLVKPLAMQRRLAKGVASLLQARDEDGLFGLYPALPGRPWLSALVLQTLLDIREAEPGAELKATVPQTLVVRSAEALKAWAKGLALARAPSHAVSVAALGALVQSRMGMPDKALEQDLWALGERLPDKATAYLLETWGRRREFPERQPVLRQWLARSRWLKTQRHWADPTLSPEAVAGVALRALTWSQSGPDGQSSLASQQRSLAQWLTARVSDPSAWFSTRDAAEALSGLGAWAHRTLAGANTVRIAVGKTPLWSGRLSGAQVVSLNRSAEQLSKGQVHVLADGDVSVSIRRKDVLPSAPRPAFSRGVSLKRRYLDPKSGQELDSVKLGQIVQVVLELSSERVLAMLALTDPLPAGLEPLDPALASGHVAGCSRCNATDWGFDYVRRRDDRIEAFAEQLRAGTHTIRYLLRATIAGQFSAPGAEALTMYSPDLFARSAVGRILVRR